MRNALIITFKDHLACRWFFQKKQAQSVRLPRTQAALRLAIMRENYLAIVWNNDIAPGVVATSSVVRTQKATHVIKKKQQQQENKSFLAERHFQGKEESRGLQQPR